MEDEIDEIWSGTDRAKERENEEGLGERDGDRQRKIVRKRRERQTDRQSESLWQEVSDSMLAEHWNVIDKYLESE